MLLEKIVKNKFVISFLTFFLLVGGYKLVTKNRYNFSILNNLYYSTHLDLNKSLKDELIVNDDVYKIHYTLNNKLEKYIQSQIKKWHPDYASVVVISDNGSILAMIGYSRQIGFNRYLPFTNIHPAASLFKIITASALLEHGVDDTQQVSFKGKGTTLYKYQLKKSKNSRWLRHVTFSDAFAKSNNVAMSKLALKNLTVDSISQMAHKFNFNKNIFKDLKLAKSSYVAPSSQYSMAEISSGFNRSTLMSPIHAALLSNIVINNGTLLKPYFVKSYSQDKTIYNRGQSISKKIISDSTSEHLMLMMEKTLYKGTARKHFKRFWKKNKKVYSMGGKTGSIKGGIPFGKNDWFTFFAKNKKSTKGVSIATLLINKDKWYVKSTQLTKEIVEYIIKNKII